MASDSPVAPLGWTPWPWPAAPSRHSERPVWWCLLLAWAVTPGPAWATFDDREDGISCVFQDVALGARWPAGGAGWIDATGRLRGDRPFASDARSAADTAKVRRLDVGPLVASWWRGERPNHGLMLRIDRGFLVLHAREAADRALRPQLLLRFADGRQRFLEPAADAVLDCSTYKGLGHLDTLVLRPDTPVVMRFELPEATEAVPVAAELILVSARPLAGAQHLDVHALVPVLEDKGPPPRLDGIAARHVADQHIAGDPQVVFADGFDGGRPARQWKPGMPSTTTVLASDPAQGFEALSGAALRVTIPRGQQIGLDWRYRFRDHQASEPEEVYFRYYVRLTSSWAAALQGGKLPGLAGTYGKAGWGGRSWDGLQGWSSRGAYGTALPPGHRLAGRFVLGSYVYHAGAEGTYGEVMPWVGGGLAGVIEPNRWHCVEQHLRLNAPGLATGLLEAWVDGVPVLRREGLRFRDDPTIRIEEVWMNVFHGGMQRAPADLHLYIDNVVVARQYIGPLAVAKGTTR